MSRHKPIVNPTASFFIGFFVVFQACVPQNGAQLDFVYNVHIKLAFGRYFTAENYDVNM